MAILVYTENWEGRFKKLTFELITYASKVAELTGDQVVALSIGKVAKDELSRLGTYGAKKVIKVEDNRLKDLDDRAYTQVIASIAAKERAGIIIFAHNTTGKALAPRVAVRMKGSLGTGLTKLPLEISPFTIYKKVFSGKAFSRVILPYGIKVLTLAQNSYEPAENLVSPIIEDFIPDAGLVPVTKVKSVEKQTGKVILTDAEIVVSGGRGMRSPENWAPIEELAQLLGAATACSRPVSDEGWRPHEEHTGQTGKIIAPNLYFAFGISGAIQHLAGVSSSKCIVAVNTDPDAPIFQAADYGIVGDAQKVLPELVKAVRAIKS